MLAGPDAMELLVPVVTGPDQEAEVTVAEKSAGVARRPR